MENNLLTKERLLKGTKYTEHVYIEELDGEILIRSLSDGEWNEVLCIRLHGIHGGINPQEFKLDIETTKRHQAQADQLTVAYGMSCSDETWTIDEVKELRPPGVVAVIARQIERISLLKEEDLDPFRSLARGMGVGEIDPIRSPVK